MSHCLWDLRLRERFVLRLYRSGLHTYNNLRLRNYERKSTEACVFEEWVRAEI